MSEQLNENPLIAALMGALVGMGLERNKAQQAAQQAVADAGASGGSQGASNAPATGGTYNDVMKQGSRGEGVKQLQQNLGITQADGIFGPNTERAVRRFQQSQGLQVDGIVGPETKARIERMANNGAATNANQAPIDGGIAPGTTQAGQPSRLRQRQARNASANNNQRQADIAMGRTTQNSSKENTGSQINEEITISGNAEDLIRLMQLAGADGAKAVDADDINTGPKPCPICGKMHGPSQPMGGCGSAPKEPGMGDMIKMIAPSEAMEEDEIDGDFQDASTEPDENYMNDVSASIPHGDDLHKKKRSYKATAGGDNPMALEDELRARLSAALAEKKQ